MARLTAPLLSLRASGSIGKALVFASWKGIPYARVHVVPANPQSAAQVEVRNVFKTLNDLWTRMPADARLPWDLVTRGLPLTDRNRLIQENVAALIDAATMQPFICSPAHGAAIRPTSVAMTGQAGAIRFVFVAPTAPVGYTLTHCVGVAIPDGVPGLPIVRRLYIDAHAMPDVDFSLSVGAAGDYYAGNFLRWERDVDEAVFHSLGLGDIRTTT